MQLMEHFLAPEVRPFAIAAMMIVIVGGVEVCSMLIGFSLSEMAGKALDFDSGSDSNLMNAISWMNVRGVPLLVYLMVLFALFSIAGFLIQDGARAVATPLPTWLAVPFALGAALPLVRWSSGWLAKIIPRDESYAVGEASLVGRIGEVVVGPLDQGLPGRVRVKDVHDNFHFVAAMAAPDSPRLPQGVAVLLVDRVGTRFLAIAAEDEILSRTVKP